MATKDTWLGKPEDGLEGSRKSKHEIKDTEKLYATKHSNNYNQEMGK